MNNTTEDMASGKKVPWHSAFYAGIQIEFADEADKLVFENEHHIGTQPKRIDVLVIKKEKNTYIEKNIGRIFRKYNIIEYKSPNDYISIDDFYLVYGYACLYKSDTKSANKILAEDITITLVCHRYPHKLIEHLKKDRKYFIELIEDGIYYVIGDFFPIQILITKMLTNKQNLWLHNLTNDIQDNSVVTLLLNEYEKHQKETHYKSIMDTIVNANANKFEEVTAMCEALEEIYLKVHGERLAREQKEAIDKGIAEGISKALDKAVAEAVAEAVAKAVAEAVAEKDALLADQTAYIKKLESQLGIATA